MANLPIDRRSGTVTRPTAGVLAAMAAASVLARLAEGGGTGPAATS